MKGKWLLMAVAAILCASMAYAVVAVEASKDKAEKTEKVQKADKPDKAEIRKRREAEFAEIDANKDGKVSKDEFVNYYIRRQKERYEQLFKSKDKDGDGALTVDEFAVFVPIKTDRPPRPERVKPAPTKAD